MVRNHDDKILNFNGITNQIIPHFFNDLYPSIIEGIYTDAKNRGIKTMIIIEPIRCLSGADYSPTCMFGKVVNKEPLYYDAFRVAIKKIQDKHPDLLVLDPVDEMNLAADKESQQQAIFWDSVHLSPKGNLLLANLIARRLLADHCGLIDNTSKESCPSRNSNKR